MSADVVPPHRMERWRTPLLVVCALRYVIPIVSLAVFATLVANNQIELLTLLRPGKEVLLIAGGFERTNGIPNLWLVFLAYVPGMVVAVWAFYGLGRAYQNELAEGDGPAWLSRVVPPQRFRQAQRVIAKRGVTIAILGRVAALPPTILAAAAGTTPVNTVRYLAADLVGAVLSFGITVGVGYALGSAYESGGIWFTVVGVVVLFVAINRFTAWLDEEGAEDVPLDTDVTDVARADD